MRVVAETQEALPAQATMTSVTAFERQSMTAVRFMRSPTIPTQRTGMANIEESSCKASGPACNWSIVTAISLGLEQMKIKKLN